LVFASSVSVNAQEAEPPQPRVVTIEAFGDKAGDGNVIISRVEGNGVAFAMPLSFSFGGFGGVPEDDLGISGSDQYQEELGLVPEQKEKLSALRKDIQERRNVAFRDFRGVGPEKVGQTVAAFETQIREDVKKKLGEILLPHQLERIKQIQVQSQMRNRGLSALSRGELADMLALTEQQKADLVEKQKKAERELREKIEALRKEVYKEVMDEVLTAEQREKLAKLTGAEVRPKPIEVPAIRQIAPQAAPKLKSGE
jgi:Spy/CpxP family protein refolding chaperone